jgi:SAM-dependent methyltransferase
MREIFSTENILLAEHAQPQSKMRGQTRQIIPNAAAYWGIRLKCPRCRADLNALDCPLCGLRMQVDRGIVRAMSPDRVSHYARFMHDYERIRQAEGRASQQHDFYLGLPYDDLSGRNRNQWKIRARSYDYLIKRVLNLNHTFDGRRILDLGAGNCWMSYRLALAGYNPVAVDLLTNEGDGLGAGEHFRKHLPAMFPRFQAELARLPFQDEQFDVAIFNASFHYAEDYSATLREALRCIKSGGMVVVSDTPWYSCEDSGNKMVSERSAAFVRQYGTPSDSIRSLEFLTDDRLRALEEALSVRWTIHSPRYGLRWAIRPLVAKLRNRREPSRFRIYVARKP